MSKTELRVVCAPLALLFGWFLIFGDTSKLSHTQLYGGWAVGVMFALCSLFGPDFAERFLGYAFGIPGPVKTEPPLGQDSPASANSLDRQNV